MRGLWVERLQPFALVAFGAGFVLNLTLVIAAISVLQGFDRVPILGAVVLFAALLVYVADRLRGSMLASAARAVDSELVPAAIANSLDSLRDAGLLRSFLTSPGMLAVFDLPWMSLYALAILWIHPLLGFAALMGAALLIFGLSITVRLQRSGRVDRLLRAERAAHDDAEDLVRSRETLVAMGMSEATIAAWRERHGQFLSHRQHTDRVAARLGAVARAGSLTLQVVMLALGAWLVSGSRLGIAPMIAAALLLLRAMQPLEQLAVNWPAIAAARGAWLQLHWRATSIVVTGTLTPTPAGRIELERVYYAPSVGRPASIRNVTLSLESGESILIVGSSGSGKTALARLLLGALRPQSGTVLLDGTELARWDGGAFGQCVGYVSQHVQLFPGTIADNIARMGAVDSTRVVQAARLAHAHEMIVRMSHGYHTQVSEEGSCLTAVQRRRIALARALYTSPRLLVLDEPNADMDVEGEVALVKTLAELKNCGVTVVVFGQRASLLEHVDRMAILRDGTLYAVERRESQPFSTAAVVSLPRPSPQPL